jgi:multiple sugar transport system permease protein
LRIKNSPAGTFKNAVWFASLLWALVMVLLPVYLLGKYSISDIGSINTGGAPIPIWPRHPSLDTFLYLFSDSRFFGVVINSFVIATLTVALSMTLGIPASYVLARYRIPWKKALLVGLISVRLFPDIASVIPIAEFFIKIGVHNTYLGIVMAHTLLALPYIIFIGTGAFEPIPRDLEHQAMVMGANRFQIFMQVHLPLAMPGLIAGAIYTFLLSWDEFIFAYFLLGVGKITTLTLYLKQKLAFSPPQNLLATISVCLSLPVIIFSLLMQRYMTAGITQGAIK